MRQLSLSKLFSTNAAGFKDNESHVITCFIQGLGLILHLVARNFYIYLDFIRKYSFLD